MASTTAPRLTTRLRSPTLLADCERPALTVLVALTAIIAFALSFGFVDYGGEVDGALLVLFTFWSCGLLAGACAMTFVEQFLKLLSALLAAILLAPLASCALAPLSMPLSDRALVAADRALFGFSLWPSLTSVYAAHPRVMEALSYVYVSIGRQPFVLVLLLCATRKFQFAWTFVTAWSLSLLLCVLVFPWCPALGAYAYFHIDPSAVPGMFVRSAWNYPVTLQNFRSGVFHSIDTEALEGIIAMPSFHAAASVLLLWGFSPLRGLNIPAALLNIAMLISAVPIGGHYGVDVLVGASVAGLSIGLSTTAMRRSVGAARTAAAIRPFRWPAALRPSEARS